jgi:hypothetical protein
VTQSIRCLALALLLSLPCVADADVKIAPPCRVKNRPPGRCGWCALETLARHLEIKALYGLSDLEAALGETGIRYRIQYPGSSSKTILQNAMRDGLGAAVGFRELHAGKGGHIVTLIDFGPDEVRVIDPNDQDGRIRTMALDRFLYWWDGFALIIERDRAEAETASARTD